jgi:hypothetical protein
MNAEPIAVMSAEPVAAPMPSRPRCGILLATKPDLGPLAWRKALEAAVEALHAAIPEADVIGSITLPLQTVLGVQFAHREMGRGFDGLIDVVLPAGADYQRFKAVASPLRSTLWDKLDLTGCTVNVGDALYAKSGVGNYVLAQLAYRDHRVDKSKFLAWWTSHHSDFNLESPAGKGMGEYALQHREDPATSDLNAELGFNDHGHVYEPVYVIDAKKWIDMITPEVGQGAYEDEKGWLSHDCMHAEILEVVARLP